LSPSGHRIDSEIGKSGTVSRRSKWIDELKGVVGFGYLHEHAIIRRFLAKPGGRFGWWSYNDGLFGLLANFGLFRDFGLIGLPE